MSQGSAAAAAATASATRFRASSGVQPGGNPTRTPSTACPGTLDGQSPARNVPTFTGQAPSTSAKGPSSCRAISFSNDLTAAISRKAASTGLTARCADSAWAGRPRTVSSAQRIPTPPRSSPRSVGSRSTAASASTPARAAASVPLPVHSSSMTGPRPA